MVEETWLIVVNMEVMLANGTDRSLSSRDNLPKVPQIARYLARGRAAGGVGGITAPIITMLRVFHLFRGLVAIVVAGVALFGHEGDGTFGDLL